MEAFITGSPASSPAEAVLHAAQLWYPVILLLAFISSAAAYSIITARTDDTIVASSAKGPGGRPLPATRRRRSTPPLPVEEEAAFGNLARRGFQYISVLVVVTFLVNCAAIASHTLIEGGDGDTEGGWWCGEEATVYVCGSVFLYLYVTITLLDWKDSPNVVHLIFWCLGLVGETIIAIASWYRVADAHSIIEDVRIRSYRIIRGPQRWDVLDLSVASARICLIGTMACLFMALKLRNKRRNAEQDDAECAGSLHSVDSAEHTPLLNGNGHGGYQTQQQNGHGGGHHHRNGAANGGAQQGGQYRDENAAFYRPDKLPHKSWWEYLRGYSLFFPYLWPSNSRRLQGVVLVCFLLLVCQRLVNLLVPEAVGALVDDLRLQEEHGTRLVPWLTLACFMGYKFLQGPSGFLGCLRSLLWIPVSQYSYGALTSAAFEHVHSLSLDFHLGKRTGEVLSALNKGASINQFLEQVTFQVFPMLVDLLIAIVYFRIKFNSVYAMIASVVTFYYLLLTIRMAATRADQRRDMVNADREEEAIKNDSITSYETVKYFNAEPFEFGRYRQAIRKFQAAEAKVTYGMNFMNICQSLVFMCGMLVAMMLGSYEVTMGVRTVGDFMVLMTYLNQLQGPLNFFGTFYRTVQQAMISGERLLELFKIRPSVVDEPGVKTLEKCEGRIRWNNVRFWYDKRRPALQDLSFECAPGTTTAFVGESGGGKSTIFRLMFRYYNCQDGSIEIDGHDVRDVTIDSVRRFIGVVPQDTILFNETLMYNLKYANQDATDDDIYEACRAASIHDRIMSFADGYDTKVGERGLRLSGGEKQRVAIARAMLKNPKIIMLDEATSALDSETEQQIQSKLITGNLGQDRTLLIIAHRLSTITHADQIVVLHAGAIVEKGTHDELLALQGRYAAMWEKQIRAERAAEEARAATNRANRLLRQANIGGGEHGGYTSDGCNSMSSSTVLQAGHDTPGTAGSDHQEDSSSDEEYKRAKKRGTGSPP